MGWFSSPRRRNTKGMRLRKLQSKIKKLEKKHQMEVDLKKAQTRLNQLQRMR